MTSMKLTQVTLAILCALCLAGCGSSTTKPAVDAGFSPAVPMPTAGLASDGLIQRIAIGSCFDTSGPDAIFNEILARQPDAFLFIGDNVYAQDESPDPALKSLKQAYADLAAVPAFTRLRTTVPTLVTWDDHDFGLDDAGGDWPGKTASEKLFEYVWAVPESDPRSSRPGVYHASIAGPPGRQVQMILLDSRYFRTPLTRRPDYRNDNRYQPAEDPGQSVLGEAQWRWLEDQLRQPADVRIIATSIQLIADGHNWEAWRMFPRERERLYELLRETRASGVIIVSGDRHGAYMYRRDGVLDYPLYELSTSSLNIPLTTWVKNPVDEPGPHRLYRPYYESNYGLISINWDSGEIQLQILDEQSQEKQAVSVNLSELR